MQDTALYQYLLSLKSLWTLSPVNLDVMAALTALKLPLYPVLVPTS